ncbi:DUF1641 domain-containing protein [candidate division KSB1 bacterium]|nr:DUF1641 domain-containing protein [candidate division KSB1 bacterium]
MDKDLAALHEKMDAIAERLDAMERRQREWAELKKDLTPIANDMFKATVTEMEEISEHFTTDDLVFLLKRLLRNTRNITVMLEQMESGMDFVRDVAPLSKSMFSSTMETLDDFEKRGYFGFMKRTFEVFDRIVTSFSEDDVRQLGDNIVLILNTVKELTQPEILNTVQNALTVYRNLDVTPPENVSLLGLLKELNDPQVRKGMAMALSMLKKISADMVEQKQQNSV